MVHIEAHGEEGVNGWVQQQRVALGLEICHKLFAERTPWVLACVHRQRLPDIVTLRRGKGNGGESRQYVVRRQKEVDRKKWRMMYETNYGNQKWTVAI